MLTRHHNLTAAGKPSELPATFAETQSIGLLWRHRAEDDDGYSREDEIEWYRAAFNRDATEAELCTWGRSPVEYSMVSTAHLIDTMFRGSNAERAARRAGEAFQARTGLDWCVCVANGREYTVTQAVKVFDATFGAAVST